MLLLVLFLSATGQAAASQSTNNGTTAVTTSPTEVREPLPWADLSQVAQVQVESGEVVVTGLDGPSTVPLVDVSSPPVFDHQYVVRLTVRYEDVVGPAYFDMWSHFPGKGAFFTRNLGQGGPMGWFEGTSGSREVLLPFTAEPGMIPERITVSLVMPGKGKVWVGPMEVSSQVSPQVAAAGMSGLILLFQAFVAVLMAGTPILVATLWALIALCLMIAGVRGRWMVRYLWTGVGVGLFFVGVGISVWVSSRGNVMPWVLAPFFVSGVVLLLVCLVLIRTLRQAMAQEEERRMREMDLVSL